LAEVLRALPPEQATELVVALPSEVAVELFDEPELEGHRNAIACRLPPDLATRLIAGMSADQQADLLREVEPADRRRLLDLLDPATRQSLSALLAWPPDSAGGIMTTEFTGVPPDWTARRVLAHLRQVAETKETIYAVYVLEQGSDRLQHVVSLRELLQADAETPVRMVAPKRRLITILPGASRLDAGRLIGKYNLLALPVVDETGRLLG